MYLPSLHRPPMYVPHLYCSHIIFHLYCSILYLHIRPMYMPHLYCSHIIFLPAAKCILTSSAYTILVHITTRSAADAIIGKGERGQFRQKFDHHYSKWVGLLITLTNKDKKENKKKKRFISRD